MTDVESRRCAKRALLNLAREIHFLRAFLFGIHDRRNPLCVENTIVLSGGLWHVTRQAKKRQFE